MRLRSDAIVRLDRVRVDHSHEVFRALWNARFEPDACRRALAALDVAPELYDIDAIARGGRIATDRLVWDVWQAAPIVLDIGTVGNATRNTLTEDQLPAVAAVMILTGGAADPDAALADIADIADDDTARLFAELVAREPSPVQFPAIDRPGIYRREHGSLVIRSHTTTVITDPQGGSQTFTSHNYPTSPQPIAADGLLITHMHDDHWAPASLLASSHFETRVIVPPVPRASLLAPTEPVEFLTACDVAVTALPWGEAITIGDIRIEALPFYGEQPTRDADLVPHELRNWGSCYRIETPELSVLVLADSGIDPAGSMADVIARSVAARGPVDCVASCALPFLEAVNPGLPNYALVLPFDYLARAYANPDRPSMTGGPDGAADACVAAGARYYLPYAHGFDGLGIPTRDDTRVIDDVAAALASRNATTTIHRWTPGDVLDSDTLRRK